MRNVSNLIRRVVGVGNPAKEAAANANILNGHAEGDVERDTINLA